MPPEDMKQHSLDMAKFLEPYTMQELTELQYINLLFVEVLRWASGHYAGVYFILYTVSCDLRPS
jgi:hypothetical protein